MVDPWCRTIPLKHSFSILFDLAVNKFETMADVGIKLWGMAIGYLIYLETLMTRKWIGCGPS